MNRSALIKAAYFAVIAMGETPTRRSVRAMLLRMCGRAFRNEEVAEVMALLQTGTNSGPTRDQMPLFLGTKEMAQTLVESAFVKNPGPNGLSVGDQSGTTRASARGSQGISRDIHPSVTTDTSCPSFPTGVARRPSADSQRDEPLGPEAPEWAKTLRTKIVGLRFTELKDLSIPERLLLGRYHAFRFGNCTKAEANNRARGSSVAAQLATMCVSDQFGDFTIAEYLAKAREYHATIDLRPWFRPWQIKAVCDATVLDRRSKR